MAGSYDGSDIKYVQNINDATSCQVECQELTECKFWTYNSETKNCWLQTEYAATNVGTTCTSCTRGPKHCPSK